VRRSLDDLFEEMGAALPKEAPANSNRDEESPDSDDTAESIAERKVEPEKAAPDITTPVAATSEPKPPILSTAASFTPSAPVPDNEPGVLHEFAPSSIEQLRQAVIWSEILAAPLALREERACKVRFESAAPISALDAP
jgi:hypothetical protein